MASKPRRSRDYRRFLHGVLPPGTGQAIPTRAEFEQALERLDRSLDDEARPIIEALQHQFVVAEMGGPAYFALTFGLEGMLAILSMEEQRLGRSDVAGETGGRRPAPEMPRVTAQRPRLAVEVTNPVRWRPRDRAE